MYFETTIYRISIDKEWEMYDLHQFPHYYSQLYAVLYFLDNDVPAPLKKRESIFQLYPWRGGYSAVYFYRDLYFSVDKEYRPFIRTIKYSSPGYIDILCIPAIAVAIAVSVTAIAKAVDQIDKVYDNIYKRAQERKLLSMDTEIKRDQLEKEHLQFILQSTKELAEIIRFEKVEELQFRTQDNLATLKILMSFYRRIRKLAEYVIDEKVNFGNGNQDM